MNLKLGDFYFNDHVPTFGVIFLSHCKDSALCNVLVIHPHICVVTVMAARIFQYCTR